MFGLGFAALGRDVFIRPLSSPWTSLFVNQRFQLQPKTCACATQALFDYIGCVFNNDVLVFCQDMSSQIQWIQNG